MKVSLACQMLTLKDSFERTPEAVTQEYCSTFESNLKLIIGISRGGLDSYEKVQYIKTLIGVAKSTIDNLASVEAQTWNNKAKKFVTQYFQSIVSSSVGEAHDDLTSSSPASSSIDSQLVRSSPIPLTNLVVEQNINLEEYPKPSLINSPRANESKTVGDTHASAIKLLHFLIRQSGLVLVDPLNGFSSMQVFYRMKYLIKKERPTSIDVLEFIKILNSSRFPELSFQLRFLGDIVADRETSDLWNLLILYRLKRESYSTKPHVKFVILDSNHGAEFSKYVANGLKIFPFEGIYTPKKKFAGTSRSFPKQHKSLLSLDMFLESNQEPDGSFGIESILGISFDQFLYEAYFSQLKILDYSVQGRKVELFAHGVPNFLQLIALLHFEGLLSAEEALRLRSDPKFFTSVIDQLNQKFCVGTSAREVATNILGMNEKVNAHHFSESVFGSIVWARYSTHSPLHYPDFVTLIHGHDGPGPHVFTHLGTVCLNDVLGRSDCQMDHPSRTAYWLTRSSGENLEELRLPRITPSSSSTIIPTSPRSMTFLPERYSPSSVRERRVPLIPNSRVREIHLPAMRR